MYDYTCHRLSELVINTSRITVLFFSFTALCFCLALNLTYMRIYAYILYTYTMCIEEKNKNHLNDFRQQDDFLRLSVCLLCRCFPLSVEIEQKRKKKKMDCLQHTSIP